MHQCNIRRMASAGTWSLRLFSEAGVTENDSVCHQLKAKDVERLNVSGDKLIHCVNRNIRIECYYLEENDSHLKRVWVNTIKKKKSISL